jgi:hypothetical protein
MSDLAYHVLAVAIGLILLIMGTWAAASVDPSFWSMTAIGGVITWVAVSHCYFEYGPDSQKYNCCYLYQKYLNCMLGFLLGFSSVGGGILLIAKQPEIAAVGWCLVSWGALLLLGFGYHYYDQSSLNFCNFNCCREAPSYYHPKFNYSSLTVEPTPPTQPPLQQILQQHTNELLEQQARFSANTQAQNHASYMQQYQEINRQSQLQTASFNQSAINAMQHQASQHNYHIYTMSRHH